MSGEITEYRIIKWEAFGIEKDGKVLRQYEGKYVEFYTIDVYVRDKESDETNVFDWEHEGDFGPEYEFYVDFEKQKLIEADYNDGNLSFISHECYNDENKAVEEFDRLRNSYK